MSKNNIDIYDIAPSIEDILKENQQLRIDLKDISNKIIQLEKLVWKKVEELVNEEHRSKELYDKNIELKQEIQELKDKKKELEVLNENLNKYIDNFRLNANIQNLYDSQEIYKLKQAINILKLAIELPMENDIDYVDSKGNNLYKLRIKKLLGEEEYDLIKKVLEE